MAEQMSETKQPMSPGKLTTTIGVGMVTASVVLVFLGVKGPTLHTSLQVGGLALAMIGLIVWKVFKK